MDSREIRKVFLEFFTEKDHLVLPSFSLIPQNDPTLLLIGAGMAPLKPYFTGEKKPPYPRVATCQKCVRTPDIERVGETGRHATFFEMLGNFSFGDYFKEEAIKWAWELVTKGYKFSLDRLWVSIYKDDEESYNIWREKIGVPHEKIVRLGKEDNFWEIGVGPCGPCSEIYYDLGPEFGCDKPDCQVGCDCDRFLEIWNLVFTQYNLLPSGKMEELERKNIDTGAGLERLAMALQNVGSIYEIDTVAPLVKELSSIAEKKGQGKPGKDSLSLRIVTEHLRGVTFLVADGVLPSNEGRGYILRRLLRRALRHGRLLGIEESFLYEAVPVIIETMGDAYPELKQRADYITQIIKIEEDRFKETLNQGCRILEDSLQDLDKKGETIFPGEMAFRLYDTYGFPLDLTREIAAEKGMEIEEETFQSYLEEQREKARKALKSTGGFSRETWEGSSELETSFVGYDHLEAETRILVVTAEGTRKGEAKKGEEVELLASPVPFYAESGGQVGDTGYIEGDDFVLRVKDACYNQFEQIVLKCNVEEGAVKEGQEALARVDGERRQAICRSHTATHLLHRALKNYIGEHVNQSGSLVAPDRLRFDFTHFSSLSREDLEHLEKTINELVRQNLQVEVNHVSLDEAREMGALALFEGTYGEQVRMLKTGEYSLELCGGTHLDSTGRIGFFKFTGEEGVGAGIRRVEALTGEEAWKHVREQELILKETAEAFKSSPQGLREKVEEWLEDYRELEEKYREMRSKIAEYQADNLLNKINRNGDVNIISAEVKAENMEALRELADRVKERTNRSVVVLGAVKDGKVMIIAAATRDILNEGIHAGNLVKEISGKVGGGGGGRPEMAQAGGKNPEGLRAALDEVEHIVQRQKSGAIQETRDKKKDTRKE